MTSARDGLERRLALVFETLERSPDPLDSPFGIAYEPVDGASYLGHWADFAARAAKGDVHPISVLYVHLPFCARVCSYCLLSAAKAPGKAPFEAYLRSLRRQIALFEPAVRPLRFSSLHVGGGTPTLLSEGQLDTLLGDLSSFRRADGFRTGVEAHPGTTTPGKLRILRQHGVDRVSFGVESFTPAVLEHVNRSDQTRERVQGAVAEARRCGLSVNLDLLAGLPGETRESFAESVRMALALEPDSMSVNRFLAENSVLGQQGFGSLADDTGRAGHMLLDADRLVRTVRPPRWPAEPLSSPAYGTQYVWDAADDARPYFQQDMIGPSSTLALGHGGMGHILGHSYSIAAGTFSDYVYALERGVPPPMLASPVSARFEMAFFLAERLCRDWLSPRDFFDVFRRDPRDEFGRELAFLVDRSLLAVRDGRLRKVPSRTFDVTSLLAFLALDAGHLERSVRELPRTPRPNYARMQYDAIAAELPPSLLWCRMAIRASRARSLRSS